MLLPIAVQSGKGVAEATTAVHALNMDGGIYLCKGETKSAIHVASSPIGQHEVTLARRAGISAFEIAQWTNPTGVVTPVG